MRASFTIATTALIAVALISPSFGQVDDKKLGTIHFETSCSPEAQKLFDRGLLYQHSFWYRASQKFFEDTLKADPRCGIAYWGIAQSLLANPFNPTPAKNLVEGLDATQKGKEVGAKTQRERDLIEAMGTFYMDFDRLDQRTRAQAYVKAMAEAASRHPDDDEVQIYYALALNIAASPSDKTYVNQLNAAAILEPISKRRPQHPGVAHYLIHTYDYPALAGKGLDAALRYARIAEAAPHAQHMPSHIFTRVGYWNESIVSNSTAAKLAKTSKEADDQLHASDYMVYAYLQLGRDREARELIDEMSAVTGYNPERNTGPFALTASPARYFVERGDWTGAAQLQLRPVKFGYIDAITLFARALGNSQTGNLDAARADLAKLIEIRSKLLDGKDAYWSGQVGIQAQVVAAWVLFAEGKHEAALNDMRAAANAEDKTEKATVTPGPLAPARELLGAMLLQAGMAKEALAAFQATLTKEPNRLAATIGAATAAKNSGDATKAQEYYAKAVALTVAADPVRPAIKDARAFMAKH